jgi:hypothetical protein
MLLFPKRDSDNTPQGKLAHGCMVVIWFAFAIPIGIGAIDAVAHGICYWRDTDCRVWECGWFRVCSDQPKEEGHDHRD